MNDAMVAEDVLEQLIRDDTLDSSKLNVTTKGGNVTLSGVVSTFYDKWEAEESAWRAYGVRSVRNDIIVDTAAEQVLDADLVDAATRGLGANGRVPRGAITVTADDGWVTLAGNVNHYYQRQAAEHVVRHLAGLRGFTDNITVSRDPTKDVSDGIAKSFDRLATLDARGIDIVDEGGAVTLTGTVGSYAERQEAERAAWQAPGVMTVDNQLVVG